MSKLKLSEKTWLAFLEDWFLRDLMSSSLIFYLSQVFFCITILNAQNLKIYAPAMTNKTKYVKELKASSQTCQYDINLSEVVTKGEKSNGLLDSTGNLSESGTQVNNHQTIKKVTYKQVRLQG